MKNFLSFKDFLNESQKGTLYSDDNPEETISGMKYSSAKDAHESVDKLESLYKNKKITHRKAVSIATAMHNRAKFHASPTAGIAAAEKVWKSYQTMLKERTQKLKENNVVMSLDKFVSEKKGPCWVGYKQVGLKNKGGKMVPNCVPIGKNE